MRGRVAALRQKSSTCRHRPSTPSAAGGRPPRTATNAFSALLRGDSRQADRWCTPKSAFLTSLLAGRQAQLARPPQAKQLRLNQAQAAAPAGPTAAAAAAALRGLGAPRNSGPSGPALNRAATVPPRRPSEQHGGGTLQVGLEGLQPLRAHGAVHHAVVARERDLVWQRERRREGSADRGAPAGAGWLAGWRLHSVGWEAATCVLGSEPQGGARAQRCPALGNGRQQLPKRCS